VTKLLRQLTERTDAKKPRASPGLEPAHARLQGIPAAFPGFRRCSECWLSLTGGPLPWLRYTPNGLVGYRSPTEDYADPMNWRGHTLQGLFAGPRLSPQTKPPRRAATDQNFRERSTIDFVAESGECASVGPAIANGLLTIHRQGWVVSQFENPDIAA
jgi:hypothetical protein